MAIFDSLLILHIAATYIVIDNAGTSFAMLRVQNHLEFTLWCKNNLVNHQSQEWGKLFSSMAVILKGLPTFDQIIDINYFIVHTYK